MNNKSREKIQTYKAIKIKPNKIKNITYNKPLFINMKKENNLKIKSGISNQKKISNSTKICSESESSFNPNAGNNTKRIYSVKDFEIDSCLKTSLNFFSNYINTSINSSENYNNNFETLSPSRTKIFPFIEEENKEQFTPYLGQKKSNEKKYQENKENKGESLNENIINNEKKNYSFIFNNSKKEIESTSLNLRNHFDEQLSNKYKRINKFQKMLFYQKKSGLNNKSKSRNKNNTTNMNTNYSSFVRLNKNSRTINKQLLYKKKYDFSFHRENERKILEWLYIHNIDISEREKYEKFAIIIQTVFRGYISRIKLYNKLKLYTCITVFNQLLKNIYLRSDTFFLKFCFQKLKNYYKKSFGIYNNSFSIKGGQNKSIILSKEIKELIEQNNKLQIKLNEFLINNNVLKNDINNYKEFEFKYKNLLVQLEKLQNANNNILKENNKLIKELNFMKNKTILKSDLIEPQKIINIIIESMNNKNIFKNIQIQNINNILIKDTFKADNNNNKIMQISPNVIIFSLLNNNKTLNWRNNIKISKNINSIEIKNKRKELTLCVEKNNLSIISDLQAHHIFKTIQIEKKNNFYFSNK